MSMILSILPRVALAAAGSVGLYALLRQPSGYFGMHQGQLGDWWGILIVGYAATLIGVVCGAAYRDLLRLRNSNAQSVSVKTLGKRLSKSFDLWLGLFGSPLVYALVINATDGISTMGLVAVAIQNGFFCTVVINELRPSGENRR